MNTSYFKEKSNEYALSSPLGKNSSFYKSKKASYRSYLESKGKYNSVTKLFLNVDLEKVFIVENLETINNVKYI